MENGTSVNVFVVSGAQFRYELMAPELEQLRILRADKNIGIFNISGRIRNSLGQTRIVLNLARKLLDSVDEHADEGYDEHDEVKSGSEMIRTMSQESRSVKEIISYLSNAADTISELEKRIEEMSAWTLISVFTRTSSKLVTKK